MSSAYRKTSKRLCKLDAATRKRFNEDKPDEFVSEVLATALALKPWLMNDPAAPPGIKKNFELVRMVIREAGQRIDILKFADPSLFQEGENVVALLDEFENPDIVQYADRSLLTDEKFVMSYVKKYPAIYKYLELKVREDPAVVRLAMKSNLTVDSLPYVVLNDLDFVAQAVTTENIIDFRERYRDTRRHPPDMFGERKLLDQDPFDNADWMTRTIKKVGIDATIEFASDEVLRDKNFVLFCVEQCKTTAELKKLFKNMARKFRKDKEVYAAFQAKHGSIHRTPREEATDTAGVSDLPWEGINRE